MDQAATKYRAFISYSHRDHKWGRWLHRALESYRVDKDLVGRETDVGLVPRSLRPIFRDRDEFSAGHSLTEQTMAALTASEFLVVLCSPRAASSTYVNEEIRLFKAMGRSARVVPVIIDGKPGDAAQECFPPALRHEVGADGQLLDTKLEPVAADLTSTGDGKLLGFQKVIAGLLHVRLDIIIQRAAAAERRRRRLWACLAGLMGVLAVIASVSTWIALLKAQEAEVQRQRVETEEAKTLLRQAEGSEAKGDPASAMRYALASMPRNLKAPERALLPAAIDTFLRVNFHLKREQLLGGDKPLHAAAYDKQANTYFVVSQDGRIARWSVDPVRLEATTKSFATATDIDVLPGATRLLVATDDEILHFNDKLDLVSRTGTLAKGSSNRSGYVVAPAAGLYAHQADQTTVVVRSADTGNAVFTVQRDAAIDWFDLSPSGRLLTLVTNRRDIELVDPKQKIQITKTTVAHDIQRTMFSPDETTVILATDAHAAEVRRVEDLREEARIDYSPYFESLLEDVRRSASKNIDSEIIGATIKERILSLKASTLGRYVALTIEAPYRVDFSVGSPQSSHAFVGRRFLVLLLDLQLKTFVSYDRDDNRWYNFEFINGHHGGLLLGGDGAIGLLDLRDGMPKLPDVSRITDHAKVSRVYHVSAERFAYLLGDGTLRIRPAPAKFRRLAATPNRCFNETTLDCALAAMPRLELPFPLRIARAGSIVSMSRGDAPSTLSPQKPDEPPVKTIYSAATKSVFGWSDQTFVAHNRTSGTTRMLFNAATDTRIHDVLIGSSRKLAAVITRNSASSGVELVAHIIPLTDSDDARPSTPAANARFQLENVISAFIRDDVGLQPSLITISEGMIRARPIGGQGAALEAKCGACVAGATFALAKEDLVVGTKDGMVQVHSWKTNHTRLTVHGVKGEIRQLTTDAAASLIAAVSEDGELVVIDMAAGRSKARAFNVDPNVAPSFGPNSDIAYVDRAGRLRLTWLDDPLGLQHYLAEPDSDAIAISYDVAGATIQLISANGTLANVRATREDLQNSIWWQRATKTSEFSWGEKRDFLNSGRWRDVFDLAKAYTDIGRRCDIVGADAFDPLKTEVGKIGRSDAENSEAAAVCMAATELYKNEPRYRHQAGVAYLSMNMPERAVEVLEPNVKTGYPASYWCMAEAILKLDGGRNQSKNVSYARELVVRASSLGVPVALHKLAEIDSTGLAPGDPRQRRITEFFEIAGDAGYPKSHLILGNDYLTGEYVPQDVKKAFYHYALAAELMDWFEWQDEDELRFANRERARLAYVLGQASVLDIWGQLEANLIKIKKRVESIQSSRAWARLSGTLQTKVLMLESPPPPLAKSGPAPDQVHR